MNFLKARLPGWLYRRLTSEPVVLGGIGLMLGLLSGLGV